jgi:asparagine synthase (glutamine-hydrolysing)
MACDERILAKQPIYITNQAALGQVSNPTATSDRRLILVSDARIDNREELLDQLWTSLDNSIIVSDSDLILAAYIKWGKSCPEHLIGDFAFAIWDSTKAVLFAARDGMNMRTLYYLHTAYGLCLASEEEQLLNHPAMTPQPSELGLAGWLSGWPDPMISMFDGVDVLPPGHSLTADANSTTIRKFWDIDPEKQIRYRQLQDYEAHLHELLCRAVEDRLHSSSEVVVTQMSGGMDSTTVTALAKQAAEKQCKKLLVLSHSYHSTSCCDETQRIHAMLKHLCIDDFHFLPAEQHTDLDFQTLYPPIRDCPGTVLSPRYIDEMTIIKAAGAQVLLTGSGGDEMTWGHSLTYSQRLLSGELKVIWEVISGCREMQLPLLRSLRQLFVNPFMPSCLKRALGRSPGSFKLPDWVPKTAIHRLGLQERLLAPSNTHFHNPALQARYEALKRTSTLNSVRSYARTGAEHGIDVRHPFFDTRIAEFSFAIPDDLWIREGYPKWLLRKTMDSVLPNSVCWNRHKVIFDSFFSELIRKQPDNIRGILSDTRLQEMGLLDNRKLLAAYNAVINGTQASLNVDLLYALMTQVWYQKYWGD